MTTIHTQISKEISGPRNGMIASTLKTPGAAVKPMHPKPLLEVRFGRRLRHELRSDDHDQKGPQPISDQGHDETENAEHEPGPENVADQGRYAGDDDDHHSLS